MAFLRRFLSAAAALCCCFAASVAFAGNVDNNIYSSNLGYTIMPPSGWLRYDASTAQAFDVVPQNIKDTNFTRVDVVFFPPFEGYTPDSLEADNKRLQERKEAIANGDHPAPGTPESAEFDKNQRDEARAKLPKAPKFSANISIMVAKNQPSQVNNDLAVAFKDKLIKDINDNAGYASGFKVTKTTTDHSSGKDIFIFNMEYNLDGKDVLVEQTVLVGKERSVVVTCISNANDYLEKDYCTRTVKSIRF